MTTHHTITVNNKKYKYTFGSPFKEDGESVTHVTCKTAGINQGFATEDIPGLLADLPELIIEEKEYQKKQNEIIRFRVSSEEKATIEKKSVKLGFKSVSEFLRKLALQA